MTEQATIFSRIGKWFKRGDADASGGDLPLIHSGAADSLHNEGSAIEPVQTTRSTFLRPWARNEQAMTQAVTKLQEGFGTLTDLMGTIRDHLDRQSQRQEELIGYLSHLPDALKQIPEASRNQSEALKAIHQQMAQQSASSKQLGDILDRICQASGSHQKVLDALNNRVENLNRHDEAISDNLQNVGSAMQTVSRNSQTSAQILENLRDNMNARDGQLERILLRQNTRFTTMLAVALFLSVAALVAVVIVGYLMLYR